MTPDQLAILRSLTDGEWHDLVYTPHLAIKVRSLVQRGLIHYSCTGRKAQAVATNAGLEVAAALEPKP